MNDVQRFDFKETVIPGLIVIQPFCAMDIRGSLVKDYSEEVFEGKGIFHKLKEVFYTESKKGVVRALHFQRVKQQPKLIRCIWGRIFDVVVDLRKDSPTFSHWLSFELKRDSMQELLIPAGCAHGYLVLEHSIVSYKCSEKFYDELDDGILWNDPDIAIKWPLDEVDNKIILSKKDESLQTFREFIATYEGF